jgi:Fe-S-cluster-containing dehydrogenase component
MAGDDKLPVVELPDSLTTLEQVKEFIHKTITRRDFNKAVGIAGLGAVAFHFGCGSDTHATASRQVFVANSRGLVVHDPTNCVGCRRCEAACVAFNQGNYAPGNNPATVATTADASSATMAQPSISNIKVNRNVQYGVAGAKGFISYAGDGLYGSFTILANTCNQCPHPVPCQVACPQGAIEVVDPANARVVNTAKCVGCGICVKACPWEMTALDGPVLGATTKAHKCHLCGGAPECVAACPAAALTYVPWTDVTGINPPRQTVPASIQLPPDVANSCNQCH